MSAHNVSRETKNVVIFDVFDFFCLQINLKTGKIQRYRMDFDSFFAFYALNRGRNLAKTVRKNSCLKLFYVKNIQKTLLFA